MKRRDEPDPRMAEVLAAYRAAAWADADAHFDERALEAQRARILQRLDQAGHRARVLHFPGSASTARPATPISRRWISAAAAAGLLIGLVTGQLLHVLPGDSWVHRDPPARASQPATEGRTAPGPARVSIPLTDPDDDLLDAIDLAVSRGGSSELRALHDLTFAYGPY